MSLHGCRVSHPLYRLPTLGPKNLFRLLFPHFHSTLWIAVVSLSSEDCAIGLFRRICFNLPKLYPAIVCFYCFVTHPVLSYVLQFVFCKLCAGPWGRPAQVLMRHSLFQIKMLIYLELRAAVRNVRLYRIIDPTLSHLLTIQDTRVATAVLNSKYQWHNVITSPCTRFVFEGSSKH